MWQSMPAFQMLCIFYGKKKSIGMIVQFHQKSRLHALFPGMITESLAERVAAYVFLQSCIFSRFLDDAERLGTGEMA